MEENNFAYYITQAVGNSVPIPFSRSHSDHFMLTGKGDGNLPENPQTLVLLEF